MGLKEIAQNIKNNMHNEAPKYSIKPEDAMKITVNDYLECIYGKQRSVFSDRKWVCQNYMCVTNDGSKNLNYTQLAIEAVDKPPKCTFSLWSPP